MKTNKLIILIDSLSIGGAQYNLKLLVPEWIRIGCEVEVIAIQKHGEIIDLTELRRDKVNVHFLQARSMMDVFKFIKLLRIIANSKPFQLQCHLFWSQIWGACISLFLPKVKVVWVEHNTYLARNNLHWFFFKILAKLTQEIIVVSQEVYNFLQHKTRAKLRIIWNPISDFFDTERRSTPIPRIVFVGRLVDQKAPELALYSFLLAIEKNYLMNESEFVIVGSGHLKSKLVNMAQKSKFRNQIIFIDYLATSELASLFSQTTTLISTSKFEGFAIVRAEALAAGCTVVSTDTGGISAITTNNVNEAIPGVFVLDPNAELFSRALAQAQDKELWSDFCIDKRRSISKKFSPRVIAKSYLVNFTSKDIIDFRG